MFKAMFIALIVVMMTQAHAAQKVKQDRVQIQVDAEGRASPFATPSQGSQRQSIVRQDFSKKQTSEATTHGETTKIRSDHLVKGNFPRSRSGDCPRSFSKCPEDCKSSSVQSWHEVVTSCCETVCGLDLDAVAEYGEEELCCLDECHEACPAKCSSLASCAGNRTQATCKKDVDCASTHCTKEADTHTCCEEARYNPGYLGFCADVDGVTTDHLSKVGSDQTNCSCGMVCNNMSRCAGYAISEGEMETDNYCNIYVPGMTAGDVPDGMLTSDGWTWVDGSDSEIVKTTSIISKNAQHVSNPVCYALTVPPTPQTTTPAAPPAPKPCEQYSGRDCPSLPWCTKDNRQCKVSYQANGRLPPLDWRIKKWQQIQGGNFGLR